MTKGEAEASLAVLLWRQSLAAGPRVPRLQDIEAWINHLDGISDVEPLTSCVAVLKSGGAVPLAGKTPERWTIAVALDDLQTLAGRIGDRMTLDEQTSATHPTRGITRDDDGAMPDHAEALAKDFLSALTSEGAVADQRLIGSLMALHELHRRFPGIDYRDYRHAPLTVLVAAITLIVLVDFALRTRDLWAAPYGSASLMRAAAGLGATEMGAYGDKVGLLARSSADIYDMARVAVAASIDPPTDAREAWICFLVRNCDKNLLAQVIDDLGDVAASRPLAMILRMLVNRVEIDIGLLWQVRDAAIDNGDLVLAARAQREVADARDQEGGELLILGTLQAMAGEVATATATFRELIARQWPGATERLDAFGAGTFGAYTINRGYTSAADRQATRLHRRGMSPGYVRVRGHRINAVDVG